MNADRLANLKELIVLIQGWAAVDAERRGFDGPR
jgi:hypothetical protein